MVLVFSKNFGKLFLISMEFGTGGREDPAQWTSIYTLGDAMHLYSSIECTCSISCIYICLELLILSHWLCM